MLLPIRRQFAAHHLLPEFALFRVLLEIFVNQRAPFFFMLRAAIYAPAKVRQSFFRHEELFVFRPAEMSFRFTHGVFARRITVRFARARRRHAVTDRRPH